MDESTRIHPISIAQRCSKALWLRRLALLGLLIVGGCAATGRNAVNNELTDYERAAIERECSRLAIRYTHLVDFGHAERITDLFTADGLWHDGQASHRGEAAIRAWFKRRQEMSGRLSRHVLSNHLIKVLDRDHATGTAYFLLFRHDGDPARAARPMAGQPVLLGSYEDEYVRTAEGWRFQSRRAVTSFSGDVD